MGKNSLPDKIYLTLGGGLGDVIYDYMGGHRGWDKLESLKKAHPNIKIKVMASTHNPQTLELLKYNPYIDEVEEFGWQTDGKPLFLKHANGYIDIQQIKQITSTLPSKTPKIYLGEEDKQILEQIVGRGSFVFVHPFAGLNDRIPFKPTDQFIKIIDAVIDNTKHNVFVIGANHVRANRENPIDIIEELNYEREGLFNLVNKPEANIRLALGLVEKAHSFIGSWSCYSCAFWTLKKKTIVLVPKNLGDRLTKRFQPGGRWQKRGACKVLYIDKETQMVNVTKKILEHYNDRPYSNQNS